MILLKLAILLIAGTQAFAQETEQDKQIECRVHYTYYSKEAEEFRHKVEGTDGEQSPVPYGMVEDLGPKLTERIESASGGVYEARDEIWRIDYSVSFQGYDGHGIYGYMRLFNPTDESEGTILTSGKSSFVSIVWDLKRFPTKPQYRVFEWDGRKKRVKVDYLENISFICSLTN